MPFRLYLDDSRTPPSTDWTLAKSVEQFQNLIAQNGLPSEISFDYELVGETGMDALEWLIGHCRRHGLAWPECDFHSSSHEMRAVMRRRYRDARAQ